MTPLEVLIAQDDLRARLSDPKSGLVAMMRSQYDPHYVRSLDGPGRPTTTRSIGDEVAKRTAEHVGLADAYRVTEDMCSLLLVMAARLDRSDRVDKDLPPTPWGVVRFEKGLPIREARGRLMVAHWMTWGPCVRQHRNSFGQQVSQAGLSLTWWNDSRLPDEVQVEQNGRMTTEQAAARHRLCGPWGIVGAEVLTHGARIGGLHTPLDAEDKATLLAEGVTDPTDTTNTARYAHALWLLLDQTIVQTEPERLSKAAGKRVGRMRIPGQVSVIQLRRTAHRRSEGESRVQWAHRWVVRAHWRWQPYADGTVRRIVIAPYAKNGHRTDLPWVQTRKVYQLER